MGAPTFWARHQEHTSKAVLGARFVGPLEVFCSSKDYGSGVHPGYNRTMVSDAELLQRWRNGDRKAGAELFGRYYTTVERFFMNKVPDASTEIRDLVQETFMALVESRDRIEHVERFHTYVFSVAYKLFQNHLRKKYRRGSRERLYDFDNLSVHDVSASPRSLLGKHEEQRILLEGLRRIPVSDQTLLELYYWEDVNTAEIAVVLGIPRGTVKSRLRSARRRLEQTIRTITESAEVLENTLSDLDVWARRCRQLLGDGPSESQE